jgi:DNA-binding transcriptional MerR regulator
MVPGMTIGQLAARSGLAVRTLRFYADEGVLPAAARTEAGYRLFGPEAVARARLRTLRTLRELGVGLEDLRRVVSEDASLAAVAAAHARALDAQIQTLQLQRAVLAAVARSARREELGVVRPRAAGAPRPERAPSPRAGVGRGAVSPRPPWPRSRRAHPARTARRPR